MTVKSTETLFYLLTKLRDIIGEKGSDVIGLTNHTLSSLWFEN